MNFKQAYEFLLSHVDRPDNTRWVPIAKQAVQLAVLNAQRSYNFNLASDFGGFLYPAGEAIVDVSAVSSLRIKAVRSVMLVDDYQTSFWGDPIKMSSVSKIVSRLDVTKGNREYRVLDPNKKKSDDLTFFMVNNRVGIWPVPDDDLHLSLYHVKWLPPLDADTDTNFMLVEGFDYVVYKALEFFNSYLKEDARVSISNALMRSTWNSLVAFDSLQEHGSFDVEQ